MSNLKTIVTVPLGTIKAFETDSLFKAMYAVKNPMSMYELESSPKHKSKYLESIEENKAFLQQRYLRLLKESHVKKLTRRRIQVINDDTDPKDIREKFKIIYRKGDKWYAVVLQDNTNGGGHTTTIVPTKGKKSTKGKHTQPFKDELEEAFIKHILKNYGNDESDIVEKLKEIAKDRETVMQWINSFLSKKESHVKHIAAYEKEMKANIKRFYMDTYGDKYKRKKDKDVFESPHFKKWYVRNSSSVLSGGTKSGYSTVTQDCVLDRNGECSDPLSRLTQRNSTMSSANNEPTSPDTSGFMAVNTDYMEFGMYDEANYYKNITTSNREYNIDLTIPIFEIEVVPQTGGNVVIEGGDPVSLTQYYAKNHNTVLGDQKSYFEPTLQQGFNAVIAICDNIHDFSKELGKPQIIEDYNKNNEYVHIMNNMDIPDYVKLNSFKSLAITNRDESDYSCISRSAPSSENQPPSGISASVDDDKCYELGECSNKENPIHIGKWENVFLSQFYYNVLPLFDLQFVHKLNIQNENHAIKFAEYLKKQGYNGYFYDMAICSSEQTGPHYNFDYLKGTLQEKGITKNNTIAKWWDPSSGGEFVEGEQLADFNIVLKGQVMQPLSGNTSFESIVSKTGMAVSPDGRMITIPDTCFTINNCITYMEETEQPERKKQRCQLEKATNDKLLFYDMKRSGDHGQVMYLKHWNSMNPDKKNFLITGDSMCATKAIFEKVPVLFKKFHFESSNTSPKVDLYFYDPPGGNFTREYLIKKNKHFFSNFDEILLEVENSGQKCDITLDNNKLVYSFEQQLSEGEQELSEGEQLEDNYKTIVNIINAYDYFVHNIEGGSLYYMYLLNDAIKKVNETYNIEEIKNTTLAQLTEEAETEMAHANTLTGAERLSKRQKIVQFANNDKIYQIRLKEAVVKTTANKLLDYKVYTANLRVLRNVLQNIVTRYNNKVLDNIRLNNDPLLDNMINTLTGVRATRGLDDTTMESGSGIGRVLSDEMVLHMEIQDLFDEMLKNVQGRVVPQQDIQGEQTPPRQGVMGLFRSFFKAIKQKIIKEGLI